MPNKKFCQSWKVSFVYVIDTMGKVYYITHLGILRLLGEIV